MSTPRDRRMQSAEREFSAQPRELTENERIQREILDTLGKLGKLRVQDDALIFQGDRFILPAAMAGRVNEAISYLEDWQDAQEETYGYGRSFRYRPWDGAAAFDRAMKRVFGTTGVGRAQVSMFGITPPEYRTIDCGPGETMQVPWGDVSFSPLNATFTLNGTRDPELGIVFRLDVMAPKKFRGHIDAFFQVVEDELRTHSIYRGKAITGAADPGFINTGTVDRSRVIYSDDVMAQLDANLWSPIRHSDTMRKMGLPLKRQVLLYGSYGTGKSLAGMLTAQEAEANGWTYIHVRAGEDDFFDALKTATLYAPAVVMFEDVDQVKTTHTDGVAHLLDVLDGVTNKGVEVMALFTTNHVDKLHRGLMRPGRLDAVIELGALDGAGVRRLVEATVPASFRGEIDWDKVADAYAGLLPAFAKEATDRAQRYAIARSGGVPQTIGTEDLVHAAAGIQAQVRMMEGAPIATDLDPIGDAFGRMLRSHAVDLTDGPIAKLISQGKS